MQAVVRYASRSGLFLALAIVAGCGSSDVYPVRGQVNFEGKPMVGGGSITLIPMTEQEGVAAGGEIGEDGKYTLTTHTPGDGSMPGEFRVMIYQVTEKEPPLTEDGQPPAKGTSIVPPEQRIPEHYSTPNSPLTMKVEAKSLNEIDFDLKRQ